MKTKKKALLLSFCAVLLVVASVLGTMAFLTSQDQVLNTFTVGNVKINLDEADVTPDGVTVPTASRVHENDYKLMPGHFYTKDPTVTVLEGSEESYIKAEVTVNKLRETYGKGGKGDLFEDLTTIFTGYDATKWIYGGSTADWGEANNRTYTFYYYKTVEALDGDVVLEPIFTGVQVPDEIDAAYLAKLDGLNISVKAYAIQADGFTDAADAWANFA